MMRLLAVAVGILTAFRAVAAPPVDFNRDIRPILSNNCFACHGPDEKVRKGDLRLDTADGTFADRDGHPAVVKGKPEASELVARVSATKPGKLMPPAKTGKKLSPADVEMLTRWVKEGANYTKHWAYVAPIRPEVPAIKDAGWSRSSIDHFILARLDREGLKPSAEADRYAIARRVALDLTGLPPTVAEAEAFVDDKTADAYEKFVDAQLKKDAYGEHWARMWLDLARYADSAGYADDPLRTIWAFRDYVIKSFNANKPFDQFTIEQLAGDLLPNPTEEQRVATAFHRNTMTNSEGGTSDEEFRNVAIVDRVNTTLTTWMGTSVACAQCHNHKYDPISQKEFFQLFAFLNNTADADRSDETPVLSFYSNEQKKQRAAWEAEVAVIEAKFKAPAAALKAGQMKWESSLALSPKWASAKPRAAKSKAGIALVVRENGAIFAEKSEKTDTFTVELPLSESRFSGLRLEALPDPKLPGGGPGHGGGNFVVTRMTAAIVPPAAARPVGRFVRITLPGAGRTLSLAEVQVFSGRENVALKGTATQSSTAFDGPAPLAIDGNTDGDFLKKSVTHTVPETAPWWEVDLAAAKAVDRIVIWNRTDGGVGTRLADFKIELLDEKRQPVWTAADKVAPAPTKSFDTSGARPVTFAFAFADHEQAGFPAGSVIAADAKTAKGWAVGGFLGKPSTLMLAPAAAIDIPAGSHLVVTIEQNSPHINHTLGHFRFGITDDPRAAETAKLPAAVVQALSAAADKRTDAHQAIIVDYYVRNVAPELTADRVRSAALAKMLADQKPSTVPVMEELKGATRRKTRLQFRGNFMDLGDEVGEGIPAALHSLPKDAPLDRLSLAKWIVDPANPLTARVIANRYWEHFFGTGLVRTSEEFGAQGDQPSHPELLDWLATELIRLKWDMKAFAKLMVTSSAYRQSSKVPPEMVERDPDNRLIARGPRLRLTAEMVRDQSLFASGLLSKKMYGPSVKPPQPTLGVNAAFGGSIDWQTSLGEDRYRRGLYTEWRRSNPYPSMSTFDAPNRDICTVRRGRTNTPLQALVTLNDTVYIEAAQALARRATKDGGTKPADIATFAFRQCLTRPPHAEEVTRLVRLFEESRAAFQKDQANATRLATIPIGPIPAGQTAADLAAWTLVANVLLNLDEALMKR